MKKVALVTGSSRGIGRAVAARLARSGWAVGINYVTHRQAAEDLRDTLIGEGCQAAVYQADVADRAAVEQMVRAVEQDLGPVSLLVNNAGIAGQMLFQDITEEQWRRYFAVNLDGAFHTIQAVLPHMLHEKSGCIINTSSIWGQRGASCEVAYSATKGGINAFTKALAKELAPSGIQVNAIACGAIDTEMNHFLNQEELIDLIDEIPAGRLGKAEEVADLAYHLGYKDSYLTGQVIGLDGGWI